MNLFEKYWRKDMPQVNTNDLPKAMGELMGKGIQPVRENIACGRLKHLQHDIIEGKVDNILETLRKLESLLTMKPIVISEDSYILDGHHRVEAVKKGWGEAKQLPAIRIPLMHEAALGAFKKIAAELGERLRHSAEILALGSMHGLFTESRLIQKGFSRRSIQAARRIGILNTDRQGSLSTIPSHLREAKVLHEATMIEFLPAAAAVARVAGPALARYAAGQKVKQIAKGEEQTFQIVKDDEEGVVGIDPEDPGAGPVELDREATAPFDPEEEETEQDNAFV